MSNVSLMECENCGARAVNGEGGGWTSRGDERFHACARLPARLSPRPAYRLELADDAAALVALVNAVRRWGSGEDGIPNDAWDAYVEACRALKLPEPKDGES